MMRLSTVWAQGEAPAARSDRSQRSRSIDSPDQRRFAEPVKGHMCDVPELSVHCQVEGCSQVLRDRGFRCGPL